MRTVNRAAPMPASARMHLSCLSLALAGLLAAWPQPVQAQPSPSNIKQQQERLKAEGQRRKQAEQDRDEEERKRKEAEAKAAELQRKLDALLKAKTAGTPEGAAKTAVPAAVAAGGMAAAAQAAAPAPGSRFRRMEEVMQVAGCEACGQLSVVEGGRFEMGSPAGEPERESDEGPVRTVSVSAFAIGRTEVTQGQWKAVMGRNPSHFKDCGDACPVEGVSWEEITGPDGFLARLNRQVGLSGQKGYRLPSEAEWEYAARAGSKTAFWWGNAITPRQANYNGEHEYAGGGKAEYKQKTVRADAFEANPWGLYNVHGNVWEWVQDCWHDNYVGAPGTGVAWEVGCTEARRVVRGGSWISVPRFLRSAIRYGNAPDNRNGSIGFRLARTF